MDWCKNNKSVIQADVWNHSNGSTATISISRKYVQCSQQFTMCGTGMTVSVCCHSKPKQHLGAAALISKDNVIILFPHSVKSQNAFAMEPISPYWAPCFQETLSAAWLPITSFLRCISYVRKWVWCCKRITRKAPSAKGKTVSAPARASGEEAAQRGRVCGCVFLAGSCWDAHRVFPKPVQTAGIRHNTEYLFALNWKHDGKQQLSAQFTAEERNSFIQAC